MIKAFSSIIRGTLPEFIAAFTKNKQLSEKEIEEIRALIDGITEE